MAAINHFIGACVNPLVIAIALVVLSFLSGVFKWGRLARFFAAFAALWLWFMSTPLATHLLASPLEGEFPIENVEEAPLADAIVILGGGMAAVTNGFEMADITPGADRVWVGAELFKAERAPRIVATGYNIDVSTMPLLESLGVPEEAVRIIDARNTEEEAEAVEKLLGKGARILLVTSSWHMRRALLMFSKTSLKVRPFAADYEGTVRCSNGFDITWFCPVAEILAFNTSLFKEHYAYWGYKLIRGY